MRFDYGINWKDKRVSIRSNVGCWQGADCGRKTYSKRLFVVFLLRKGAATGNLLRCLQLVGALVVVLLGAGPGRVSPRHDHSVLNRARSVPLGSGLAILVREENSAFNWRILAGPDHLLGLTHFLVNSTSIAAIAGAHGRRHVLVDRLHHHGLALLLGHQHDGLVANCAARVRTEG